MFITSSFYKIAWKYNTYPYALTLKNSGVLTAYMYLIAEALGLKACALGLGNIQLFSKASGLNWLEDAYIADFVIGK